MFNKVCFVVILCGVSIQATIVPTLNTTGTNSTTKRAGVCHLEVPTIDLISEDQRDGVIPAGNGTRPGYSTIEICCSGYQIQPHTAHHCIPVCESGCEHGNCTAPNVCQCHKNYVKDHVTNTCVPVCPLGCLHGVCSTAGVCSCNMGYSLEPTRRQYCLPVCKSGCGIGGQCTGPDVCECKPGFEKSARGICEYHCDGGCDGGDCIGPNQCSCHTGYTLDKVKKSCVAECSGGCRSGVCTGPNKCTCPNSWTLDKTGTICLAHCNEPCLNGECTAPNECSCKAGYIKDSFSKNNNRCVAHCPGGCENGVCSGPNFCICNPGFVKQGKGSNVCVKREKRYAVHYELIPEQL